MSVQVLEIWQVDEKSFGIKWSDQQEVVYNTKSLRERCPCAGCVDEYTGKRLPKKADLDSSAYVPAQIRSIGRYALSISFQDGHNSGIYSFDSLRKGK